jgi:hypothetical protein
VRRITRDVKTPNAGFYAALMVPSPVMAIAATVVTIRAPTIMTVAVPVTIIGMTARAIIIPVARRTIIDRLRIIGLWIIISVVIISRFIITRPVATTAVMVVSPVFYGFVIAIIIIAARTVADRYVTTRLGRLSHTDTNNSECGKHEIFQHRISPSTTRKRGRFAESKCLLSWMNLRLKCPISGLRALVPNDF